MKEKRIRSVVILGAGNVAWHLGLALSGSGIRVLQVWNRTVEHGEILACKLRSHYTAELSGLDPSAQLYIMAVSDQAISDIAIRFPFRDAFLVHTSGSTGIDVLMAGSNRCGVVYPLQTFSGKRKISFRKVPVCIEASHQGDLDMLNDLSRRISENVYPITSAQRRILHVTAVFAGNFSNFLYTIAEDLLKKHDIPFELLHPLIMQTASNARSEDLFSRQTGPAIRGDFEVMNNHRELLARHAAYMEIYDLISKSIIQFKQNNDKL